MFKKAKKIMNMSPREMINKYDPCVPNTRNSDWGYPVPNKGGPTQNAILTPKMFEKELELYKKGELPFEHERYLGQLDVV